MRVLITGASGSIGAACVQRFLDEGHEVVGFDLLPATIEHERYRHLIVDVREPPARAALSPTPRTLQIAWRRRPSPTVWTRVALSRH